MNQSIIISMIQAPLAWHDPIKNRNYFSEKIDEGPRSDLWVLPEMFTTGFTMDAKLIAEPVNGETYKWMFKTAIKHRTFIGGSIVIKENGKYYNRFLVATPDGNYVHYDKRHLFTMAGEDKVFTQGNDQVCIEINNWTLNLQVCYDLRFPVFSRNSSKRPYDIILYVANWPIPRINAWDKLLMARAIENQSYVVGVNRIGKDENGMEYNGHSVCIDPWGERIADAGSEEKVLTVEFTKEHLLAFRAKFPVLNDADNFVLKV